MVSEERVSTRRIWPTLGEVEEQSLIYCNEFAGVKRSGSPLWTSRQSHQAPPSTPNQPPDNPSNSTLSWRLLARYSDWCGLMGDPRINPGHKPFLAATTLLTPSLKYAWKLLHTDCVICITYEKSLRNLLRPVLNPFLDLDSRFRT